MADYNIPSDNFKLDASETTALNEIEEAQTASQNKVRKVADSLHRLPHE